MRSKIYHKTKLIKRLVTRIKEELTPNQRKFIDIVSDKVANLNIYQFNYFNQKLEDKLRRMPLMTPIRLNTDYPGMAELENPDVAPSFFKQQELMSQLAQWLGTQPSIGGGPSQVSGEVKKEAAAEKPKEKEVKKEEVNNYFIQNRKKQWSILN